MTKKEETGTILGMPAPGIINNDPPKEIKRVSEGGTLLSIPIRDDAEKEPSTRVINRGGSVVVEDNETLEAMGRGKEEQRPSNPNLKLVGVPRPDLDSVDLSEDNNMEDIEEESKEVDERELYIPGRRKKIFLGILLILLFASLMSYLFYYMATVGR